MLRTAVPPCLLIPTPQAQANMMSWILSQRKDDDGRKQCFKSSVKAESGWADVFCTGADGGFDVAEGPPEGVHVFLTVHYVKVPFSPAPDCRILFCGRMVVLGYRISLNLYECIYIYIAHQTKTLLGQF